MSTKPLSAEEKTDVVVDDGKALTRGVSFSPGSLFRDAKNYGAAQSPSIGYSAVICLALTEYLGARGGLGSKAPSALTPEEAVLIGQAKAQGIDVRAALADALERKVLAI